MADSYIEMRNIVKVYPPNNVALKDVSVDITLGEIHSIIGENGAGKSTLMKVLFGMEKLNEGEIAINGSKTAIGSPKEAVAKGIGMVHQEFMLIGEYTVLENVVLGNEPTKNGLLNLSAARKKLEKIMTDFKFDIPLDEKVKNISIAAQQKIEIIKLLYRDVETLILDEPTAVLAPQEVDELFGLLDRIKSEGCTILFISHKLDEVLRISDRITVMRAGRLIWTRKNEGLTKADLASAMVGREVMLTIDKKAAKPGTAVLQIEDLAVENPGIPGKMDLDHVSMTVHKGEIVGVAGVEGNGQYEMVQAVMGLMESKGRVLLEGKDISKMDVHGRRRLIAYVPQDRKISGSSLEDSIETNVMMTHHYVSDRLVGKTRLLDKKKCRQLSNQIISQYQVSYQGPRMPIGALSGGNQQKVIVGREFELDSSLLVVDQPVRGLDVGSIEYIHRKIVDKRDEGEAVLLVSADLDELFNLSDRIVVMHKGKIAAEKRASETTREEIGEYMLGVKSD